MNEAAAGRMFMNVRLSDYLPICPFFLSLVLEIFGGALACTPKSECAKCSGKAHKGELRAHPDALPYLLPAWQLLWWLAFYAVLENVLRMRDVKPEGSWSSGV